MPTPNMPIRGRIHIRSLCPRLASLDYFLTHATARFRKALEFPVAVYKSQGEKGLQDEPRIIVGTIHSVKGGEADAVYLFPDLSAQAYQQLQIVPREARPALVRQVYVAMTRAREALYLCEPGGRHYWNWR